VKQFFKYLLSAVVVAVAVAAVLHKYWDYVINPWTRDGQVRAEVIQVTARVSGPIIELAVKDNQFVSTGSLLFAIDPRTFQANLAQARAEYGEAKDNIESLQKQLQAAQAQADVARAGVRQAGSAIEQMKATIKKNKAELERQRELLPKRATSQKSVDRAVANYQVAVQQRNGAVAGLAQAQASLVQSQADVAEARAKLGAPGSENASIRAAQAAVRQAQLNLEFTEVRAAVDGYITNLNLRLGSQAVANQPVLALVDINSYWVHGFFKETAIANMRKGDKAIVTLMTYPQTPLEGHVDSLGWGIAQQDGSTGFDLLPNISPTFEWIRLAQRVPVRIHLDKVPKGIDLRVGTTASVLVMTDPGRTR